MQNPEQLVGKVLNGKYEVLGILGVGGMGVVYKVRHLILKKRNLFALKILLPRFSKDSKFQERFLREVEVAMGLTHENIVQTRDFGKTEDGLLFFTMDFCHGRALKDVIAEVGAFPPERAAHIAKELLRALSEAHRVGVVHRDLKPDNILLVKDGERERVKILDFGIAKLLEGDGDSQTLTQGGVIGTPKYMSTEQAAGEAVDGRSDLYSLGVVLYEMLTGSVPFSGRTARSILMAHLTTPPPAFTELELELKVPVRLERFVLQLLAKDRDKRPPDATTCIGLLEDTNTLDMSSKVVRAAAAGKARSRRGGGRGRRGVIIGVAAALLLLAVPGIWFGWQSLGGARSEAEASARRSTTPLETAGGESMGTGTDATETQARVARVEPPQRAVDEAATAASVERSGESEQWTREVCDICKRTYAARAKASGLCCSLPLRVEDAVASPEGDDVPDAAISEGVDTSDS